MLRTLVVLAALASEMAFGQSRPGSSPGPPSQPMSRPGADTSSANDLQMKSIDQVLHDDPKLSSKLQDMLPPDLTPQQACAGFKTLEQCITTIHVAQNLKLPFADLKSKTTGKGSVGLQKAIEQMATSVNAKEELKKAKKQAAEDMKGTNLFGLLFFPEEVSPPIQPVSSV
jgi:hypothetical protein